MYKNKLTVYLKFPKESYMPLGLLEITFTNWNKLKLYLYSIQKPKFKIR